MEGAHSRRAEPISERILKPWVGCAHIPSSERSPNGRELETLFHDTLKDIYYAERNILKALPKMQRGAEAPELKQAFEKHKAETEGLSLIHI